MNIGIKQFFNSSNVHNSVIFRHSATMFTPVCSVGKGAFYGTITVCVGPVPILLPSCAHMHLGPEAQ